VDRSLFNPFAIETDFIVQGGTGKEQVVNGKRFQRQALFTHTL
jgi:hypothetical protein